MSSDKNERDVKAANDLLDYVNAYGYHDKEFAQTIAYAHPTLQQSAVRLFITTLREVAKRHPDGRNEASVNAAKIMIAALEEAHADCLPFI